jgi:hypothetical protein
MAAAMMRDSADGEREVVGRWVGEDTIGGIGQSETERERGVFGPYSRGIGFKLKTRPSPRCISQLSEGREFGQIVKQSTCGTN